MAIRVVSDYIFKLDDKYLRVKIGFVNSTSVIELFVCGVLAYYKPLFTEDIESDSDMKLIAGVIRGMSKDKPRWISNECAWIVSEFEEMIFHQRLTTYDFGCYEDGMYLTVIVMQKLKWKLNALKRVQNTTKPPEHVLHPFPLKHIVN